MEIPKHGTSNGQLNHEVSVIFHLSKTISFPVSMKVNSDSYKIKAGSENGALPDLSDFISLLGNQTPPYKWAPKALQPILTNLSNIQVKEVRLRLQKKPTTTELTFFSIKFLLNKTWTIIPTKDFLSVGNLWTQFDIEYPLDNTYRFPRVKLGGEISLAGGTIQLQARWPDLAIAGALKKGEKINLDELLTKVGLPLLGTYAGKTDLQISRLTFSAKPEISTPSYSFSASLDTAIEWIWKEKQLFLLEQISLDIDYVGTVSGSVGALLKIAGLELYTTASHDINGWNFSVHSTQEFSLRTFAENFFNSSGKIPANFNITALSGAFNFGKKDFSFEADVEDKGAAGWNVHDETRKLFLRQLGFKVSRHEGEMQGELSGKFTWDTFEFLASARYNDGWFFEAELANTAPLSNIITTILNSKSPLTLPSFFTTTQIGDVKLSFNSHTGDKHLQGTCKLQVGALNCDLILKIDLSKENGVDKVDFSGHLEVKSGLQKLVFDVLFDRDHSDSVLVATYHDEAGKGLTLKTLMQAFDPSITNAPSINVKDIYVVYSQSKGFILHADIDAGLDLSELPLVGKTFPADSSLSLTLKALYASADFDDVVVKKINSLLPQGHDPLPVPDTGKKLSKGTQIISRLQVADNLFSLPFALSEGDVTTGQSKTPVPRDPDLSLDNPIDSTAIAKDIKWIPINKTLGIIFLKRIGAAYDKSSGSFFLFPDASLDVGGLSLSLDGLGVKTSLSPWQMNFYLDGLSLDFSNGPVEIGAAFLRQKQTIAGKTYDVYNGVAQIKTKALAIAAMGSYMKDENGANSLFIYAYLDKALGGPSFFFVEGLAAAFGYNRKMIMPDISAVGEFPLVKQVMGGKKPSSGGAALQLQEELNNLSAFITPDVGEMFLGVGVKFNSFKLIDSFVLLVVQFGNHVEIDVVGQSKVLIPPGIEDENQTLASMRVNLTATFLPEEGFLGVRAQIDDSSYIISKNCKLSGGAAFYSWFKGERAGDFVFTMGGYHPSFNVPDHYPQVPRLELKWQINSDMSVKGNMYFALCPHSLMAGGHLEVLYNHGKLKAWYNIGADFLIQWQPYHYEASMYFDIGIKYSFLSLDLAVNMDLWGPEFAGKAKINVHIASVEVTFGDQNRTPPLLDAAKFMEKCVPDPKSFCAITLLSGQHGSSAKGKPIVNSKDLKIMVESVVPLDTIKVNNNVIGTLGSNIIIHPNPNLVLESSISLDLSSSFNLSSLNIVSTDKNFPSALWRAHPDDEGLSKLLSGAVFTVKQDIGNNRRSFLMTPRTESTSYSWTSELDDKIRVVATEAEVKNLFFN
ncbi:MAG: DUF6603 domain-containing protein [Bacteroidota bacterium]